MTIKITTKSQNTRTHRAVLSEGQIKNAIARDVALAAHVGIDSYAVTTKVIIRQKDQVGTAGLEYEAEVTITEDMDKYLVEKCGGHP